ncbi:hypothetical protein [Rudanella lutea]|uniref:hypothetical protein n=1 Tax=Rudanella lutea TaxID=451374 RepID=UPI0003780B04|nr:hypothetical protein [Rudanella lutea]
MVSDISSFMDGAASLPVESVTNELTDEAAAGSGTFDSTELCFFAFTGGPPAVVRAEGVDVRL